MSAAEYATTMRGVHTRGTLAPTLAALAAMTRTPIADLKPDVNKKCVDYFNAMTA